METTGLNNPLRDSHDSNEPPAPLPGTSDKYKAQPDDLKPTSKGVENAKKRLRAFSIQKKSSLSPIPSPKPVSTIGSVGTVFIGKLATSKPVLKPGDIEEVADPKKPPKPPKPGTNKLQNADYLNIQKKTLSEIEDMKRKMELVDLGIPLGLICPVSTRDKAMPTKAMPPIKSMLLARKLRVLHPLNKEVKKPPVKRSRNIAAAKNPAKVDEIIREAKQARAEGKQFKFNYEKLLPSYQNPFQKSKDKDVVPSLPIEDHRQSRDRRNYSEKFRRFSGHNDDKRIRDWHRDGKDRVRANIIREREERVREEREQKMKRLKEKSRRDARSKNDGKSKRDVKSKEKDSKSKEKVDTINLTNEEDDDVQVIGEIAEKAVKETDVNLNDFVVCDSWSENEDKAKDSTPGNDKKGDTKDSETTPDARYIDPMEQLKQSLIKEEIEPSVEGKIEKLQPVTDSFKYEIEDENEDEEILDMFAEGSSIKKLAKRAPKIKSHKKNLYDSPVPIRFDYNDDTNSNDALDESFLESVIAEIKQEDIDEDVTQDKALVEYDMSPKEDERESVTPELDDKIREMYSSKSDYSDGFKSVESVKSTESDFKSTESGYKSTESGYKSTESGYNYKSIERLPKSRENSVKTTDRCSPKVNESRHKSVKVRSKSIESHKSTDSGDKLVESRHGTSENSQMSTKKASVTLSSIETPRAEGNMSKSTADSLDTWSFVLKICQPLLFRHDKNKCYKESRGEPKMWWCENPKLCDCVKDRSVVYEELEMCKMDLVNSVYGTHQVQEAVYPEARGWYPAAFLTESGSLPLTSEWEAEDSQERPTPPPHTRDEMVLDREYQKFMEAVWPDVEGPTKSETPRSTPVRDTKKRPGEEQEEVAKKKRIKLSEGKMSSEGWSQESEVEEEVEKIKKQKGKRKRKHSTSISDSADDTTSKKKKKKKALKKEKKEKGKSKVAKRQRLSKKYLKKLKEKHERQLKKKKLAKLEESDADEQERERKKKEKKLKKKKTLKLKKKNSKKKSKARSSSSSSSDTESNKKSKKKGKKKKSKTKQSSSDSNPQEYYDDSLLHNMKSEMLTDDEKSENFSPNKMHREIINVHQLQNDFVSIQIKKEVEDVDSPDDFEEGFTEEEKKVMEKLEEEKAEEVKREFESTEAKIIEPEMKIEDNAVIEKDEIQTLDLKDEHEFKEPECTRPVTPQLKPHLDENNSQCSSQESITSVKPYEKDDSHLRPSSQNSNYNFHDVMQNESHAGDNELYAKGGEIEIEGDYEQGNYEMYEQMAMEYQSDVASQRVPPPDEQTSGRIETVVMSRTRGEIKCDWRAGDPADPPAAPPRPSRWQDRPPLPMDAPQRPSRWGLKPNEVNIVLTGGNEEQGEEFHIESVQSPTVYRIQSLANRTENSNSGYDEAYMDMYGASDRLQYGDCFSRESAKMEAEKKPVTHHVSSLDDRINLALRTTVLGNVANDEQQENEVPNAGGILVTKSLADVRSVKRVSFADGYKPGQDSDTEEPPVRKRKKVRRTGCPWPCPATHRDHVSLWDALPPPPPPPGSPPPPPPRAAPPPASLLRAHRPQPRPLLHPHTHPHHINKFDPNSLVGFMPPEPPPGLISF